MNKLLTFFQVFLRSKAQIYTPFPPAKSNFRISQKRKYFFSACSLMNYCLSKLMGNFYFTLSQVQFQDRKDISSIILTHFAPRKIKKICKKVLQKSSVVKVLPTSLVLKQRRHTTVRQGVRDAIWR